MISPEPNRSRILSRTLLGALALGASTLSFAAQAQPAPAAAAPAAVPEAEEAFVHKIETPQPQWAYVRGGWGTGGTRIFDGKTGKMRGMIATGLSSDMAIDPSGRYYYVSETMWTKGNRGTRQDVVSIYDTTELKLQTEIPVPGRAIIGGQYQNFVLSDDGKIAYVYNLSPASSVNVVDLAKRKFLRTIELPGCASLMPNPGVGFSALCSDGTLATVATSGSKPVITRTASFFSATADPIFSNFNYDKAKSQATMLSYTGLIYQVKIGATPTVDAPWSIQQAAGMRVGDTKPIDINWYPGGGQPTALHRATGHLYVLMHKGEYWSHKEPAEEIWEVDLATKKIVKRFPLKNKIENIQVTQDATPLLFINGDEGTTWVLDAKTYEEKQKIEKAGGGGIITADASAVMAR
jgi:methylamine dehydrogenase heavy chain